MASLIVSVTFCCQSISVLPVAALLWLLNAAYSSLHACKGASCLRPGVDMHRHAWGLAAESFVFGVSPENIEVRFDLSRTFQAVRRYC
jgi:hypothetical protein